MNRSYCACPHCGKQFPVSWYWDTDKFAYLDDTVAEVVTDRDCLDATRAVYVVRRRCPYCGARLRVWHELVPRFYAFEEVDHDARPDRCAKCPAHVTAHAADYARGGLS